MFTGVGTVIRRYLARRPDSIFANSFAGANNSAQLTHQAQQIQDPYAPSIQGGVLRPFGKFLANEQLRSGVRSGFGQSAGAVGISDPFVGANNTMQDSVPSFAEGGMMGEDGQPVRPGVPVANAPMNESPMGADAPAAMNGTQLDQEAQKFVKTNPQVAQQVQAIITKAMQSGELTPDELNMAVQLAKTALANPATYPQVRQFAIQNGLGTEADLPKELDQGLLFTLILVGKTMQAAGPVNADISQSKPGVVPEYSEGGMTGDKPHLAKLHAREYVIPEKALLYHGKKTFDRMIEQAMETTDEE